MKTFRQHINESRMTTHQEIVNAIAAHKKAGEILNPQYKDLVDQAKRIMRGNTFASKPDGILELIGKEKFRDDADLNELYYTSFDSFASHNKIEKLIAKLKKKNIPEYKSMIANVEEYLKKWKPVGQDLKAMKDKVVKVTTKREQAKEVAAKEMGRKFADSSSLIKIFESHLEEYKNVARARAKEFVDARVDSLKRNGNDLNKLYPRPSHYDRDYKEISQKRNLIISLTDDANGPGLRDRKTDIRKPSKKKMDHFIDLNVREAEESYRSFMQKMIEKIGKPVVDAEMHGNIWTNAVLTVTTNDGEKQVWNTKMILNFSKYNKMFNQFPTRRKS